MSALDPLVDEQTRSSQMNAKILAYCYYHKLQNSRFVNLLDAGFDHLNDENWQTLLSHLPTCVDTLSLVGQELYQLSPTQLKNLLASVPPEIRILDLSRNELHRLSQKQWEALLTHTPGTVDTINLSNNSLWRLQVAQWKFIFAHFSEKVLHLILRNNQLDRLFPTEQEAILESTPTTLRSLDLFGNNLSSCEHDVLSYLPPTLEELRFKNPIYLHSRISEDIWQGVNLAFSAVLQEEMAPLTATLKNQQFLRHYESVQRNEPINPSHGMTDAVEETLRIASYTPDVSRTLVECMDAFIKSEYSYFQPIRLVKIIDTIEENLVTRNARQRSSPTTEKSVHADKKSLLEIGEAASAYANSIITASTTWKNLTHVDWKKISYSRAQKRSLEWALKFTRAYSNSDPNHLTYKLIRINIKTDAFWGEQGFSGSKTLGLGNCLEFALAGISDVLYHSPASATMLHHSVGDHGYFSICESGASDTSATDDTLICDAWGEMVFPAKEYQTRFREIRCINGAIKSSPFYEELISPEHEDVELPTYKAITQLELHASGFNTDEFRPKVKKLMEDMSLKITSMLQAMALLSQELTEIRDLSAAKPNSLLPEITNLQLTSYAQSSLSLDIENAKILGDPTRLLPLLEIRLQKINEYAAFFNNLQFESMDLTSRRNALDIICDATLSFNDALMFNKHESLILKEVDSFNTSDASSLPRRILNTISAHKKSPEGSLPLLDAFFEHFRSAPIAAVLANRLEMARQLRNEDKRNHLLLLLLEAVEANEVHVALTLLELKGLYKNQTFDEKSLLHYAALAVKNDKNHDFSVVLALLDRQEVIERLQDKETLQLLLSLKPLAVEMEDSTASSRLEQFDPYLKCELMRAERQMSQASVSPETSPSLRI
jgi:hypothetical protein